jgi:hypothetical protein
MLAGNIVQVRPERKALSAAVGPTCCSGREQRSKTAFAGSAIPLSMKAALRKQLRVQRRALREPDHRHRSLASSASMLGAGDWARGVGTMIAPLRSGLRPAIGIIGN